MKLTFEQFRATKHPCDDETWALIQDGVGSHVAQSSVLLYADGYAIHLHEGQYFVHAWWYAPVPYSTLDEAELNLYPWYEEFV